MQYSEYIRTKENVKHWKRELYIPEPGSHPVSVSVFHTPKKDEHALVNTRISQHHNLYPHNYHESLDYLGLSIREPGYRTKAFLENFGSIQLYRQSARFVTNFKCTSAGGGGGIRGSINNFSDASRRSLKHVSANCFPEIKSQFLLTYHKNTPTDGRESKKHLNSWLTRVRRKYKGIKYLWILEFTRKGRPHYHVYFTSEVSSEMQLYLAVTWRRVTSETYQHLKVHLHENNFISWDMGKGNYVCKYLEKKEQKHVPPGYRDVGRFWGSSRNFVPVQDEINMDTLQRKFSEMMNPETGEITKISTVITFIHRTVRRWHEKTTKYYRNGGVVRKTDGRMFSGIPTKKKIKKSQLRRATSCLIPSAGVVVRTIIDWLSSQSEYQPVPF